jgi:hypothetical protein
MREKVSKEEISEDEIYQPHPNFKDHELDGGLRVPGELWSCLFDYQKTCMFDTHNVHLLFIYLFLKKRCSVVVGVAPSRSGWYPW